jgi:uncharacterized FAD-dependent dehydrogenase
LRIPVEKDGIDEYLKAASEKLNISEDNIKFVKMLSKSLDARGKNQFYYEISIVVSTPDSFDNGENFAVYTETIKADRKPININERPVIIGFGLSLLIMGLNL